MIYGNYKKVEDLWLCSRPTEKIISDEGLLVINKLLLSNPFVTSSEIKTKLNLVVESKTVGNYIYVLGWRKVNTKYCQIVSPVDRLTRFIYACFCRFTTCVLQDSDILEFPTFSLVGF
jgi:hypothetical protein